MAGVTVTLEEFIAMPSYRRNLHRKYTKAEFPPDDELPPPAEYSFYTKTRKPCVVYFIQAGQGPIKIGVATNINKRLSMLQVGNHEPLSVLATVQGGINLETKLHWKFHKHRVRGEWFEPHPDILAEIERLNAHPTHQEPEQRQT